MSFYAIYPPIGGSLLPPGAATAANQLTQIGLETDIEANTASIDSKIPALGQATMANSLPVAIASDQSSLPVTGPFLTDAELRATPVPVSGPLTDAELRASAVPVSGPLTDVQLRATPVPVSGTVSTGGLTDAELRATPVPVSLTSTTITGSVAVTGPLTDTELRASAVPVSMASSPLPTGAATEATLVDVRTNTSDTVVAVADLAAKSPSADVVEAYDYRSIAYVGATQKIDTITYKTGGSGGTTVATQTFGYDGSDRLTSITKT